MISRFLRGSRPVRMGLALVTLGAAACGSNPLPPPPPPPQLSLACPANVDAASAEGGPAPVTFTTPTAAGGAAPVSVTCTPSSGAQFSPGATPVTCTATDAQNRQATCAFVVNLRLIPRIERTRFMTFGDSLTEGKISLTASTLVDSPEHSYPFKLLGLLRERYSAQEITVLNEGQGGERVSESWARLRAALSTHQPEAVLLMHGINDLNGTLLPGLRATADAIEELVKESRNSGAVTFVATLPPLGPGPKAGCPECVEPLNEMIRAIAVSKGATLVDVHAAWGGRDGLMGADGIHPTEAGYQVIAEAFFEAIRKTLEIPEP